MMTHSTLFSWPKRACSQPLRGAQRLGLGLGAGLWLLAAGLAPALAQDAPNKAAAAAAARAASQGVPLSELAPGAPDSYTVKAGDTLWGISSLFLKSPWRWPDLWGMNKEQIRNPNLIYPGQVLGLDKSGGMARLKAGAVDAGAPDVARLSPRPRASALEAAAVAAIPMGIVGPFLTEAVVFEANELETAPRVVATQEGRVLASRGETAYVLGDLKGGRSFRLYRELKPLHDPENQAILGYEARYVGAADLVREGETPSAEQQRTGARVVPATFRISTNRMEVGVGDRLAPSPSQDSAAYVPRAPEAPIGGRVISVYGENLSGGQNQVVSLNRGSKDGLERGHVLALWRAGKDAVDTTQTVPGRRTALRLPDERHGNLFVFRVFERVSYALVVKVQEPVQAGDRFSEP